MKKKASKESLQMGLSVARAALKKIEETLLYQTEATSKTENKELYELLSAALTERAKATSPATVAESEPATIEKAAKETATAQKPLKKPITEPYVKIPIIPKLPAPLGIGLQAKEESEEETTAKVVDWQATAKVMQGIARVAVEMLTELQGEEG